MNRCTRLSRVAVVLLLGLGSAALLSTGAASATVCEDGWISPSVGSGTCSWHGGVDEWSPGYSSPSTDPLDDYYDSYLEDSYPSDSYESYPVDPYDSYADEQYDSYASDPCESYLTDPYDPYTTDPYDSYATDPYGPYSDPYGCDSWGY